MKKILVIALTFILVTSSLSLDSFAASPASNITIGMEYGPPSTFFQNPTAASFGNTAIDVPYLPVGHLSINGSVLPEICTVPTPVPGVTNDTQWIVNLISPNLKWSDGVPINSTDLAYSFGIFLPTGPYANTSNIDRWGAIRGTVQSVSILNSTAVVLKTFHTDAKFPLLVFLYSIYPYHYYKSFGFGNNVLQSVSVLGGPGDSAYVPVGYTAGSYTMTLQANPYSPSWHGKTPTISTVTLQFFTSDSAQTSALAAGTIDAGTITPSDISALASNPHIKVSQVPSDYQLQIYIKTTGYPWNDTAFRQALFYLLPSNEVKSSLYDNQTATGNPQLLLPQVVPTYYAAGAPVYNYSVSTADSLLAKAGLVQTSGHWYYANGTAVTITVEAPNNDPNYVRASQFVQSAIEAAGINVNLENPAYATVHSDWTSLNFQLLVFPNNYAPVPFRWMRNPSNLNGWKNSTFTTYFNEALDNPNQAQSLSEIKQAELVMAQAAVLDYLVVLPQYVAYNDLAFSNWQPALGQSSYDNVFCDTVVCENVLTSVTPASPTSTITTTSSSSSTSTAAAPNYTNYYYAVAAVAIVVIIIAAVAMSRRKPSTPAK
jgi:ABC-type transport system substrate-binding protein